MAVKNVVGCGSEYLGRWKLAFRFEGVEWNVGWVNDTLGKLELRFVVAGDIYIVQYYCFKFVASIFSFV